MSRLLDMLSKNPVTIIVKLPIDSKEYAKAAEASGADAIMINCSPAAKDIISAVSIPVGLDISSGPDKDIEKCLALKFDFINFHPSNIEKLKGIRKTKIASLDEEFSLDKLMSIPDKNVDAIDAAIIPASQAAKELVVGDLQNYIAIALSSNLPIIVPTQRNIRPSEVPIIWDTGAKGMILTDVVLGESIKSMTKSLSEYRAAADNIDAG